MNLLHQSKGVSQKLTQKQFVHDSTAYKMHTYLLKASFYFLKISEHLQYQSLQVLLQTRNKLKPVQKQYPYLSQLVKYCSKKANLRNDFHDHQNLSETPIIAIDPTPEIFQTLSGFSCPTYTTCFIQNVPVAYHYRPDQQLPPYLIRESQQLSEDELKRCISALANEGLGSIIVVDKHEQNRIKSGFSNITQQNINFMEFQLKRTKLAVFNNQFIDIKLEAVPFFTKFDLIMDEAANQQCIRIVVKVDREPDQLQKFFYVSEVLIKNHKPVVHYNKIIMKEQIRNEPLYEIAQVFDDQVYLEFIRVAEAKTSNINKTIKTISLVSKGVTVSRWSFSFAKEAYQIAVGNTLFVNCYNTFLGSNFEQYFRPLNVKFRSIAVALFKDGCDPDDESRHIQNIFEDKKIAYDFMFPFPSYQKEVLKFQKEQNFNNLSLYYVCFYPFQQKYKIFESEWKKKIQQSPHIKQKITIYQVTKTIKIGMGISSNQKQLFYDLLSKKFKKNINFSVKGTEIINGQKFINAEVNFNAQDFHIAMYAFSFAHISNMRGTYGK